MFLRVSENDWIWRSCHSQLENVARIDTFRPNGAKRRDVDELVKEETDGHELTKIGTTGLSTSWFL